MSTSPGSTGSTAQYVPNQRSSQNHAKPAVTMDRRPPPDKKPSTHYAAMQELKSMTEERDAWRLLANSYVDMYRKVFNKIITMEKCSCQEMEKLYKEILKG